MKRILITISIILITGCAADRVTLTPTRPFTTSAQTAQDSAQCEKGNRAEYIDCMCRKGYTVKIERW